MCVEKTMLVLNVNNDSQNDNKMINSPLKLQFPPAHANTSGWCRLLRSLFPLTIMSGIDSRSPCKNKHTSMWMVVKIEFFLMVFTGFIDT